MLFFFSKVTARAEAPRATQGKPKSGGMPPSARQSVAALARLGCKGCPLYNAPGIVTPFMAPTLVKGAEIYFLAEAPGRDEDENTGKPLTGSFG